jgi:hypothetical protein
VRIDDCRIAVLHLRGDDTRRAAFPQSRGFAPCRRRALPMRQIIGTLLLGLAWLIGMGAFMIGLDDLLFGAKLNALFLWSGAVVTSTVTVELAESVTISRE